MGSLGSPEGLSKYTQQNQHIQVFARVRPANALEKSKHSPSIIDCPGTREVIVKDRGTAHSTKTFTFDRVFGPNSKQIDVYKTVVAPLLEQVLLGYNCTVFAYGQTGTGKTFTMEGERSPNPNLTWENDPLSGIVPRAMSQLFDELRSINAEFTIRVSLLELYNEELYDLLAPGDDFKAKTLRLYEDANRKGSVIIQGLEEVIVNNRQDVYKIMERGSERRRTAATQLNAASSRSHSVFTVLVHIRESNLDGEELVKIGKLHLVDLAGSENIGRSGAVEKRAREAGSINQSLLTLGRVITALVENAPHIPYRESKLTRILQDSLGGRTKTSIIATVSPALMNAEETLSTLDYAYRAKNITNRPECNQKLTKKEVLKVYNEEIERLKRDLLASREKNGVFVDKDNYEKMENQIFAQSQEIQDLTNAKKELEESVTQKEEELAALGAQLEETMEELSTCNLVLDETRNALEETKENLRGTITEREQQKLLVKKHVLTEKKLSSQAKELITVSDETVSSLDKMHRKLERKKNVELANIDAGRRFNKDITEQLQALCASLDSFRVGHATFCGEQRMKLENFLEIKDNLGESAMKQVEELTKDIQSIIITALGYVDEQVKEVLGGNKENVENNARIRSALIAKSESFAKKLLAKSNSMLQKCSELEEITKSFGGVISSQFQGVVQSSEEFRKDMEESLASQKSTVQKLFDEYSALEEQNRELLDGQKLISESRAAAVEEKVNNIMDLSQQVLSEVSSWKSGLITEVNTLESNLSESGSVVKKFLNQLGEFSGTTLTKTQKLNTEITDKISATKSLVPEFETKILAVAKDISSTNSTINSLIGKSQDCVKKELQNLENATSDSIKALETKLTESHAKITLTVKDLEKTTVDKSGKVLTSLSKGLETDKETILSVAESISSHCVQNSKFSDDSRSHVLQQSGKINEFWDSTYLVDTPTGATPQRKVYDYPRSLSATSPHEKILNRYRMNINENSFSEEV